MATLTRKKDAVRASDQLFRPPVFVQKGPLQYQEFGSPLQTQMLDHFPSWPLYFSANGDLQDLIYSDLLRFILPTHSRTHWIKFTVISSLQVALLMYTWKKVLVAEQTNQDDGDETTDGDTGSLYSMLTLVEVMCLAGWFVYILPTLRALSCDWMNPCIPGWNRQPIHVPLGLYSSVREAREAACQWDIPARPATPTSNVWRLDSHENEEDSWQFCLCQTVEQALQLVEPHGLEKNPSEWQPTIVPSNWTRQGHDKPIYTNMKYPFTCQPPIIPIDDNPTGIYKRQIAMPDDWSLTDGSEYAIVLQGAESACYVYWNGHRIGFSKDSRLPCEFDVTPYLRPQDNELMVVVIRWSDGSYMEDQDDWWMAGLHRSVEFVRRPPKADILQYVCHAKADGQLDVQVYCRLAKLPIHKRFITFALYEDGQRVSEEPDGRNHCMAGPCLWTETVHVAAHSDMCTLSKHTESVQQWTAETPNLYTLVISLSYKDDSSSPTRHAAQEACQVESCRIGFRTVSIENGQLCVNGSAITVCGMNRHEHDPDTGKAISIESMERDVCILKRNNFNAIRTSHYPNHSAFYRICDFMGMYVVDEANVETHGMKPMGRLAHDPGWEATFVSRITRIVQRDYNHACIIYWSMGNEAGRGCNFVRAKRMIQQLDNSRPIGYESGGALAEGTGRTELTDIVCTMYPDLQRTLDLAIRSDDDRPVVLCEYAHSMGNSNGNLHLYWKEFWNKNVPRLQGGFVWDMVDQGLRVKLSDKKGDFYFAYGGDFDDHCNDRQFCINGMFSPDREPHPAVSEVKYLQQPVVFECLEAHMDANHMRITVKRKEAFVRLNAVNRYTFRDLSHIVWSWQLTSNRSAKPIRGENFQLPSNGDGIATISLTPAISRVIQLEKTRPLGGNSFFLNIRGRLRSSTPWANAGHVIVKQQFPIRFCFEDMNAARRVTFSEELLPRALSAETTDAVATIFWTQKETTTPLAVFDKKTGALLSYSPSGKNLLQAPLTPNFTRAATDNDRGGVELVLDFMFPSITAIKHIFKILSGRSHFSHLSNWSIAGLSQDRPPGIRCRKLVVDEVAVGRQYNVSANCEVYHAIWGAVLMNVVVTYVIFADGKLRVSQRVVPRKILRRIPSLPRVGVAMQLSKDLFSIQYYGRGPDENYPDRKSGSEMGVYETVPTRMGFSGYIVPGETGSRSDCEWISFRSSPPQRSPDTLGAGLLVVADQRRFSCSAIAHTAAALNAAHHTCDLPSVKNGQFPICVAIDHKMMGLGGDVSWYPCVYPNFLVDATSVFEYSFVLCPLGENDEAAVIARTVQR